MRTPRVARPGRARRPPWSMALVALLLAAVAGGCQLIRGVGLAEPTASIVPGPVTNVSLGIYSGRPDPSWSLTEQESAEFGRLLGSLPSTVGEPPEGGLGYHGFFLTPSSIGQPGWTLVAFRGAIAAPGSGSRPYLVDRDRTVERYLLDSGRSHLTAEEIEAVESDLAPPQAEPQSSGIGALLTQPPPPVAVTPVSCPSALLAGTLAVDPEHALGVRDEFGLHVVVWPFGYSVAPAQPPALLDSLGGIAARVGDAIQLPGGEDGQGRWVVCPNRPLA